MRKLPIKCKSTKDNTIQVNTIRDKEHKPHKISLSLDKFLLEKVNNYLQSQWAVGDYTHSSLSSFLRSVLLTHQQGGLTLNISRNKSNPKKELTLRVDEELFNFYNSLPISRRTEIIEKIINSYLIQFD